MALCSSNSMAWLWSLALYFIWMRLSPLKSPSTVPFDSEPFRCLLNITAGDAKCIIATLEWGTNVFKAGCQRTTLYRIPGDVCISVLIQIKGGEKTWGEWWTESLYLLSLETDDPGNYPVQFFPSYFAKLTHPHTYSRKRVQKSQGVEREGNLANPLPFFSCSLSLYVTTVYFSVPCCYYKTPDNSNLRREVFIWTHCWRVQSTMAEETGWLTSKAADHSVSAVRRQREINACFQHPHSFLCNPGRRHPQLE